MIELGTAIPPITSPDRPRPQPPTRPKPMTSYPLIAGSFLLLAIPGLPIFQVAQKQTLAAKNQSHEAKIDLKDACEKEIEILRSSSEKLKNAEFKQLKYAEEYTNGWPVLRWVCVYDPGRTDGNYSYQPQGLDLDRYCQEKYPDDKIKPSHHDYLNPNSLYCTRPKP